MEIEHRTELAVRFVGKCPLSIGNRTQWIIYLKNGREWAQYPDEAQTVCEAKACVFKVLIVVLRGSQLEKNLN